MFMYHYGSRRSHHQFCHNHHSTTVLTAILSILLLMITNSVYNIHSYHFESVFAFVCTSKQHQQQQRNRLIQKSNPFELSIQNPTGSPINMILVPITRTLNIGIGDVVILSTRLFSSSSSSSSSAVRLKKRNILRQIQTKQQQIQDLYEQQNKQQTLDQKQQQQQQSLQTRRSIVIPELIWRKNAIEYQQRIINVLQDGLIDCNERKTMYNQKLDPKHPIYNFLIDYYGLKGSKGLSQLIRWAPSIYEYIPSYSHNSSSSSISNTEKTTDTTFLESDETMMTIRETDVILQNVKESDLGTILNLRGIIAIDNNMTTSTSSKTINGNIIEDGFDVTYNPFRYHLSAPASQQSSSSSSVLSSAESSSTIRTFSWYKSLLQQTLTNEPIFHCYGLHEWAMMYWPDYSMNDMSNNHNKPPSSKYQQHIPLRITQNIINEVVERKHIQCTHYDAIRFFAPGAQEFNKYGSINTLDRIQQLQLEQPGCIHGHMDLLKIIIRLQPFIDCTIQYKILHLALKARTIDVAASPYDVTTLYNIPAIPIETIDGQRIYQQRQIELYHIAQPIRQELLYIITSILKCVCEKV